MSIATSSVLGPNRRKKLRVQDIDEQADDRTTEPSGQQSGDRWQPRDLIWVLIIVGIIMAGQFSPYEPVSDFFGSFGWLTKQALIITRDLFEAHGYLTVFLAPLMENTLFVGALIPGTLVMLLAGLSVDEGLIAFWPALLLGIIGAMIGDTISYGMGRYGSRWLGPESRLVRWAEGMREPLLGHSIWLVLTYHFAGYSRLIGPAAAGFLRMPLRRWMLLDYIGVSIWVTTYITAGYLLGRFGVLSLDVSDKNIRIFEIILFAFFVLAILSVMRTSSARRARATEEADTSTTT